MKNRTYNTSEEALWPFLGAREWNQFTIEELNRYFKKVVVDFTAEKETKQYIDFLVKIGLLEEVDTDTYRQIDRPGEELTSNN